MKKPEEYLKHSTIVKDIVVQDDLLEDIIKDIIKQAQIDVYNEALEDAAKNVETHDVWNNSVNLSMGATIEVDKQSILKLKK